MLMIVTEDSELVSLFQKRAMRRVVEKAKEGEPRRDSNDLGKREFYEKDYKGASITQKLHGFLHFYLTAIGVTRAPDEIKKEAYVRYEQTMKLALRYLKEYIIPNGIIPPNWEAVNEHEYHEMIFERVVFYYGREVDVNMPITGTEFDQVHNHLIPLHLMNNYWGSKRLLRQALNNHRKGVSDRLKRLAAVSNIVIH
jgi:hypothetical protein